MLDKENALYISGEYSVDDAGRVKGWLLYAENFPGAYARGREKGEALKKIRHEAEAYTKWSGCGISVGAGHLVINELKCSSLAIEDADSDIIFASEKLPLTQSEYSYLKSLAIKSAEDLNRLYLSVPDKDAPLYDKRETFYGPRPVTARQIYDHTSSVTSYYCGEIGVSADNCRDIHAGRIKAFDNIEHTENFLNNRVFEGSYDEQWSLRKVLRRFIWHDRIHAKSIYRGCIRLWGADSVADPFFFKELV